MAARHGLFLTCCGLSFAAGCQTLDAGSDVPAVITEPDDASRAALRNTLAEIYDDRRITIADDALTTTSLLILEIGPPRTGAATDVGDRQTERPLRIRLVRNGDDCVLIDLRDDSRHALADTNCVPE